MRFTPSARGEREGQNGRSGNSHGLNAHSGLYEWAARQFTSNGLAVYALDHRGRGHSEGERFFVKKFADWTTDLATFIDIVKAREPGLPVFLLGHSAGGAIACGYTLEHQDELAGLICEDFAYQIPAPDVALAILKGIGLRAWSYPDTSSRPVGGTPAPMVSPRSPRGDKAQARWRSGRRPHDRPSSSHDRRNA